ncbi:unnamed protein product [Sphagnum troendelagicum]
MRKKECRPGLSKSLDEPVTTSSGPRWNLEYALGVHGLGRGHCLGPSVYLVLKEGELLENSWGTVQNLPAKELRTEADLAPHRVEAELE